MESRKAYCVEDLQGEIKVENRVGTLEQIEENIEVMEMQVRVVKKEEKEKIGTKKIF